MVCYIRNRADLETLIADLNKSGKFKEEEKSRSATPSVDGSEISEGS